MLDSMRKYYLYQDSHRHIQQIVKKNLINFDFYDKNKYENY